MITLQEMHFQSTSKLNKKSHWTKIQISKYYGYEVESLLQYNTIIKYDELHSKKWAGQYVIYRYKLCFTNATTMPPF